MVILWRDLNQRWQECDARNILQIMIRWVGPDSDLERLSQKVNKIALRLIHTEINLCKFFTLLQKYQT